MSITLARAGVTETLPLDLMHTSEFSDWSPVDQAQARSLSGALLLDVGTKLAGRPITLEGDETTAWMARAQCARIDAWKAQAGQVFQLTIGAAVHDVVFDHDKGGFVAEPIVKFSDPQDADWYIPHLHFLTV